MVNKCSTPDYTESCSLKLIRLDVTLISIVDLFKHSWQESATLLASSAGHVQLDLSSTVLEIDENQGNAVCKETDYEEIRHSDIGHYFHWKQASSGNAYSRLCKVLEVHEGKKLGNFGFLPRYTKTQH